MGNNPVDVQGLNEAMIKAIQSPLATEVDQAKLELARRQAAELYFLTTTVVQPWGDDGKLIRFPTGSLPNTGVSQERFNAVLAIFLTQQTDRDIPPEDIQTVVDGMRAADPKLFTLNKEGKVAFGNVMGPRFTEILNGKTAPQLPGSEMKNQAHIRQIAAEFVTSAHIGTPKT